MVEKIYTKSLSSKWKTEWVREYESGNSEDGEDDGLALPCVIGLGKSGKDCIWRGSSQRSVGSSFHRQGAVRSVPKWAISDFQTLT